MDRSSDYLFSTRELRDMFDAGRQAIKSDVDKLDPNQLLNTSPADLCEHLVAKYTIEPVELMKDGMSADEQEAQYDARRDSSRYIRDQSRPFMIPAQRIEVEIPFTGEAVLLSARASTYSSMAPRAAVRGQSLFIAHVLPHDTNQDIKDAVNRTIADIEQHLGWQRPDIDAFNASLPTLATSAISARRDRLLTNQGRLAALGIPLKVRPDAPKTYVAPAVRVKVVPKLAAATTAPYVQEPALEDAHYEHILTVLQNMIHVIERSPSAFAGMKEEDLRQHFLVQLNGQFEGAATGETFNVNGKTDILLRVNDRNIFIAECKFWKGPKNFREAIDQLLSYTSWRDAKTAILVFNRGTAMSTVLEGVDGVSAAHTQFKRKLAWRHESGFRYVFQHAGDPNRELTLTVLVFDVPSDATEHQPG
jgi:hypothetical protein